MSQSNTSPEPTLAMPIVCLAEITYAIAAMDNQMSSFDRSSGMHVATQRCPPSFQMLNSIHIKFSSAGRGVDIFNYRLFPFCSCGSYPCRERCRRFSTYRTGSWTLSSTSRSVRLLNHGTFVDRSIVSLPLNPERGIDGILSRLKPVRLRKLLISA